jgi:hypothetical protein
MSDALAYLRDEHPDAFELAAWTRERVLGADPDLRERVYRGWRASALQSPLGIRDRRAVLGGSQAARFRSSRSLTRSSPSCTSPPT